MKRSWYGFSLLAPLHPGALCHGKIAEIAKTGLVAVIVIDVRRPADGAFADSGL